MFIINIKNLGYLYEVLRLGDDLVVLLEVFLFKKPGTFTLADSGSDCFALFLVELSTQDCSLEPLPEIAACSLS